MSAVPVTYKHVDAVLRYGLPTGHSGAVLHLCQSDPVPDVGKPGPWTLTLNTATLWGDILLDANWRNLQHLYPATSTKQWGRPIDPYKFTVETALRPRRSSVTAIKLCQGLAYQCSDHPDWKDSLAERMLDAIIGIAIRGLPGYDEAPWTL